MSVDLFAKFVFEICFDKYVQIALQITFKIVQHCLNY